MTVARPRARDLGIYFPGQTGPYNAITDVPGVEVGYRTLISGSGPLRVGHGPVRTGVTAILPRGRDGVGRPCAAGFHSLNGNGEMTGMHWIREVGELTMPITISSTHAIGACHTGVVEWINKVHPRMASQWLLPICAETWDGYLHDINGGHVTPADVRAALDTAAPGPIAEGSVGGGTGMNCYAFKGGNGTSSRTIQFGSTTYTVGVFVQANFGSRDELTIHGVPVGRAVNVPNPMETRDWLEKDLLTPGGAGSVIVVVATDAPLVAAQCEALARRVPMGLARTGTTGSLFSGDLFLAFSIANDRRPTSEFANSAPSADDITTVELMAWARMDAFYAATVYAVKEAVVNALVAAEDMTGRNDHFSPALPHGELRSLVV
jgi:D-aminopeptidase